MSSLTEVILADEETPTCDGPPQPHVHLIELLGGESYAAVDNSGSTGGARLRVDEAVVPALGVLAVNPWYISSYHL
jgi:hypothetical protein